MRRLTERDEFGNADIIGVDSAELQGNLGFNELNRVTRALNRLAELEDKLENGQLLELPCIKVFKDRKTTKYQVCFINFNSAQGALDYYLTDDEAHAETLLKQLQRKV